MATQNPRTGTSQQLVQVTLSNALDQREKRLIEIAPSQTVRDAVIQAEMAPSGQFDVFSSVGEVVTQKTAAAVEGETLYIGPARIAGGSSQHLTMAGIQNLVLDFPTLLPVHDMIVNEKVEMFSLTVPDRLGATRSGFFRLAIHCPNPMNQMPSAYVLNHQDIQRGRYIIAGGTTGAQYDYSKKKLPGSNKPAHWVCNGNYEPTYKAVSTDIVTRISGFLNHIISVLNS